MAGGQQAQPAGFLTHGLSAFLFLVGRSAIPESPTAIADEDSVEKRVISDVVNSFACCCSCTEMLVGSVMHRKDMSFVNVRPVFRRQAAQDHGFQSFVRCDVRNHLLKRRLNQPCPPTRAKWIPVIAQLPLSNQPPHNLSYKIVCQQIASAIVELVECSEQRLLTVDFPPEKSETSAGTLVSRFENNMNMCEKILEALSVPRNSWSSVGGNVEIRDNMYVYIS